MIQKPDTMVAMDSANMHSATLAGCKVISIWGAIHYFACFEALYQPVENMVQVPTSVLTYRPYSVF